jgi:hypothetical protein
MTWETPQHRPNAFIAAGYGNAFDQVLARCLEGMLSSTRV